MRKFKLLCALHVLFNTKGCSQIAKGCEKAGTCSVVSGETRLSVRQLQKF